MKRLIILFMLALLAAAVLFTASCSVSVTFEIFNNTNRQLKIVYYVKNEFLYNGLESHHEVFLKPGERAVVVFSWQQYLNSGFSVKRNYISLEAFKVIFAKFDIYEDDLSLYKRLDDIRQDDIIYEHPFISSYKYIYAIGN